MGIGDHKITCINNSSKIKSGFKVGMSNSLQGLFFLLWFQCARVGKSCHTAYVYDDQSILHISVFS